MPCLNSWTGPRIIKSLPARPQPPAPTGAGTRRNRDEVALGRNGDVDRAGRLVGEPMQFGGGLVAEHGAGPGGQQCGQSHAPRPGIPLKVA